MAKKKEQPSAPINPDLPGILARAREKALAGSKADVSEDDARDVPLLVDFLGPRLIEKIDYKGQGDAPKVLREPMAMLSWDRLAGRWKWSLSDKALNIAGVTFTLSLGSSIADLERDFREDRIQWKERKVT